MRVVLIAALFAGFAAAQNPIAPLAQNAFGTIATIPNSSTGTTINKLASLTGGKAIITTAGATSGVIGIVIGGAGTAGSATIQTEASSVSCVFDGATTAGDYVQISASVNGDCTDAGATLPSSGQVLGTVLSTNGGGGNYKMLLNASGAFVSSSGSSGGSSGQYSTASVGYTVGTYYFPAGGGLAASATRTSVASIQGSAGTISKFNFNLTAGSGTGTATVTWYDGATAEPVTCTVPVSSNSCSDTTHTFNYLAGDALSIQVVIGTATITSPVTMTWGTGQQGPAGTSLTTIPYTVAFCTAAPCNTSVDIATQPYAITVSTWAPSAGYISAATAPSGSNLVISVCSTLGTSYTGAACTAGTAVQTFTLPAGSQQASLTPTFTATQGYVITAAVTTADSGGTSRGVTLQLTPSLTGTTGPAGAAGPTGATGPVSLVTNAKTSTYQTLASDFASCKSIPVASGTFTITLVASGSQPASGQCVLVINYGSGVVTVAPSGQNLNGSSSSLTLAAGSASAPTGALVISDGTNYEAQVFGAASVPVLSSYGKVWVPTQPLNWGTSTAYNQGTAHTVVLETIYVPVTQTLNHVNVLYSTPPDSGGITFGVYNAACTSLLGATIPATTGTAGTSTTNVLNFASPLTLQGPSYYVAAVTYGSTTPAGYNPTASSGTASATGSAATPPAFALAANPSIGTGSSLTFPATCGTPTVASNMDYLIWGWLMYQ